MADRIPVKAIYSGAYGSSDVTSLGEYTSTDTIDKSYLDTDLADKTATNSYTATQTFKGITETEATSAASTYTVDLANGTIFEVTNATVCTVTVPSAATAGKSFTVISTVPAAWAGTIKWSGSAAPSGGAGVSIYTFISNGTNWYGMRAGTNFG
jgi:hypothetical protein